MRKIQCEACPVRAGGAVCNVPPETFEEFRAMSVSAVYKPRQVIFAEGNPCGGLYLVCYGAVKLFHSDRFGRDHILEIAGSSSILGELSAQPDEPMSVSAETLTEAQLSFFPRDRLVSFMQTDPMIGVRLIEALSRELALARRKVRDLALKRAESRLAALLLQLAESGPQPREGSPHVRYTRREIAEMIGVSTETAIRLLTKLRQKQAIRVKGRDIAVTDVTKLTQVANYDTGG